MSATLVLTPFPNPCSFSPISSKGRISLKILHHGKSLLPSTTTVCYSSRNLSQSATLEFSTRENGSSRISARSLIDRYGIDSVDKVEILATGGEDEELEGVEFDFRYGRLQVREYIGRIKALPRVEVFDLVEKVGDFSDVSDFNDMLMALVVAKEHELAIKLFSKLPCHELVADSCTWSIMIRCYAKMNKPDNAKRVLEEMLGLGFRPSLATFTVLINSFCRRGKLQRAYEVLDAISGMGIRPSVQTYNCLIKGLCYIGKVDSANELLRSIKESATGPDIYSYTAAMDGFCKVGRSGEALELLKEAVDLGLKPSVVTYNTLLNGYVKEGTPMKGIDLLKQMQATSCWPDFISYSTLLHGLLKWGKVCTALQICNEMMSLGFEVDERMMNTLLRALCRRSWKEEELFKDVNEVFNVMHNGNYDIYPSTFSLVVQTLCIYQNMDKALVNLREMLERGLFPRMIVFNSVIRMLCSEGKVDEAMLVLTLINEQQRIPSVISYNLLINEFNRQRRWLEACLVYGAALKLGVFPHKKPRKAQPVR